MAIPKPLYRKKWLSDTQWAHSLWCEEGWVIFREEGEEHEPLAVVDTEVLADVLLGYLEGLRVTINLQGGIVQDAHCSVPNVWVVVVDWEVDELEEDHTYAKFRPDGPEIRNESLGYDMHAWVYEMGCWQTSATPERNELLAIADVFHNGEDDPRAVTYAQLTEAKAPDDAEQREALHKALELIGMTEEEAKRLLTQNRI